MIHVGRCVGAGMLLHVARIMEVILQDTHTSTPRHGQEQMCKNHAQRMMNGDLGFLENSPVSSTEKSTPWQSEL